MRCWVSRSQKTPRVSRNIMHKSLLVLAICTDFPHKLKSTRQVEFTRCMLEGIRFMEATSHRGGSNFILVCGIRIFRFTDGALQIPPENLSLFHFLGKFRSELELLRDQTDSSSESLLHLLRHSSAHFPSCLMHLRNFKRQIMLDYLSKNFKSIRYWRIN